QAEKDVLNRLASALEIPLARASELFDSLEQVDELLSNDASVDPVDVLLHTAMRVHAPEDFERLAAMSARAGVKLHLRLYASLVRGAETMRERTGTTPRSLSAAGIAGLRFLADALLARGGGGSSELGGVLASLVDGLEVVEQATALRPLLAK